MDGVTGVDVSDADVDGLVANDKASNHVPDFEGQCLEGWWC
jgi:hypothetical protein